VIGKSENQRRLPRFCKSKMLQRTISNVAFGERCSDGRTDAARASRRTICGRPPRACVEAAKTEPALAKFAPGTAQHSLSRNRLHALRTAAALVEAELAKKKDRL
jgi:hypothetical protein